MVIILGGSVESNAKLPIPTSPISNTQPLAPMLSGLSSEMMSLEPAAPSMMVPSSMSRMKSPSTGMKPNRSSSTL